MGPVANPNPLRAAECEAIFNGHISDASTNVQRTLNGRSTDPTDVPTVPKDVPTVIGRFQWLFTIALSIVQNWDVRNTDNRVNSLDVNEFR